MSASFAFALTSSLLFLTGHKCSVITNSTQPHISVTAIADGELETARSAAFFDVRHPDGGGGTYLPPYINGHGGGHSGQKQKENGRLPPYINGHSGPAAQRHPEQLSASNVAQESTIVVEQPAQQHNSQPSTAADNHGTNQSRAGVTETQSTTCHITTEQLVATAQASVTRVVKGLVTSDDLASQMAELVGVLTDRLSEIKDSVSKLEGRVNDYNEALKSGKYQQMETLVPCEPPKVSTLSDVAVRKTLHQDGHQSILAENTAEEETSVRGPEILKYNSSIHMEASHNGAAKKVFTYYWKVPEMNHKLTGWTFQRSLRSQSFYIYPGGYRLYLRILPRKSDSTFYVHVGVTKGDFDESLKWPYPLKMRVAILDQTRDVRTMFQDLTSRVWDPTQLCSEFNWQRPAKGDNYECVGLGFPHDVLFQRSYVFSDSLVVKLTVYLDS